MALGDGVDEAIQEESVLVKLEAPDIDLLDVPDQVLENTLPDTAVGREPLQRRPPEGLLVVSDLPERVLRRVPHGDRTPAGWCEIDTRGVREWCDLLTRAAGGVGSRRSRLEVEVW